MNIIYGALSLTSMGYFIFNFTDIFFKHGDIFYTQLFSIDFETKSATVIALAF
jgi:hypothetical protein